VSDQPARLPSEVTEEVNAFDSFATKTANFVGRATFFLFCVALVVIWFPSVLLIRDIDTWQLIINTATTIITFLMVALLQNTQARSDQAVQHKLNALAQGLADLMTHLADHHSNPDLEDDRDELRQAVGLEEHEGSSHNERDVRQPERAR
jgi:low affinity Fe/Cu permease